MVSLILQPGVTMPAKKAVTGRAPTFSVAALKKIHAALAEKIDKRTANKVFKALSGDATPPPLP
jgi:hypothetical protein